MKQAMQRFVLPLSNLINGIKRLLIVFKQADICGRIALLSTLVFMAGGMFANKMGKALLRFLIHMLMIVYFSRIGIAYLIGTSTFRDLNVRLYSAILLVIWFWLYVRTLQETMRDVETDNLMPSRWWLAVAEHVKQRRKARKDYMTLLRNSDMKGKLMLISPFLVMGGYQLSRKAWIKGVLLLSIQVGFLLYMAVFGVYDIIDFLMLNTAHLPPEFIRPSTFNLAYGYLAFFIITVFLYVYTRNIKTVTIMIKDKIYAIKPFLVELKELRDHRLYVSLLTFPILGVLAFTVLPLVFMISIAFTGYQGSGQHFDWIGFKVFRNLILIQDNLYTLLSVIEWTIIWASFATFTTYFGGIFLASLINKKVVRFKKFWRTVFIITMATPQFVSLLIMNQMFAFNGPVNQFLLNMNLITGNINFWGSQSNARALIILVNMWVGIPYLMLLTSGILMNIPEELYEAAIIEGANKGQLFVRVTMPYMLFVTAPLLVTGFIHNLNNFNVIYLLTQGRPLGVGLVNAGGTDILITWLYQLTRTFRLYNLSAAIGIIIFIISASISLTIYRRTASYKREGEFA